MSEYAGALRGARLRRMDNLNRERHDFNKDISNRNFDLSQRRYDFSRDTQLKNMDMRRNEIAKRDARDQRDSKFRHRVQSFREKLANADLEAKNEDREYAKSLRSTITKVNTLPHDVVSELADFSSGRKNNGFKNFSEMRRTEDNGLIVKDAKGNEHSFSPLELNAIVQVHSQRQNTRLKNQREEQKFAFTQNQNMEKTRLKRLQPMKNVAGYFFNELKNRGYDTNGFMDEDGKYTPQAKDFFDSVQYFRTQGMNDVDAMGQAATQVGIRRLQDYQGELDGVNRELAEAEAKGERGKLWDTANYNRLQSRQEELQGKINSMSKGQNKLVRQVNRADIEALAWAKKNPNDPRSRKILEMLSKKY